MLAAGLTWVRHAGASQARCQAQAGAALGGEECLQIPVVAHPGTLPLVPACLAAADRLATLRAAPRCAPRPVVCSFSQYPIPASRLQAMCSPMARGPPGSDTA